tara:strand:+ start:58 stop:858 length:801 start_codon:yes stop_codon:yes gene_type:complete
MRTLVGMVANQRPFLPKYTQQVVKARFEYFSYNGANWGIMFKGEGNEFGSSSNVSDKFSFGEHMLGVPSNDRDKVYIWGSVTSPYSANDLNQTGGKTAEDIYMIRLNSFYGGTTFQIGNESSHSLGSDFDPTVDAIFGEIEFKHGKLLREKVTVGSGHHIAPTPEGERPTTSSYDTTYRIVPRSSAGGLSDSNYVNSINDPAYTARVESATVAIYCPSPYFCVSQGYINWDYDRTATVNAYNMRQSLATVGETEDMFIYYKGVDEY